MIYSLFGSDADKKERLFPQASTHLLHFVATFQQSINWILRQCRGGHYPREKGGCSTFHHLQSELLSSKFNSALSGVGFILAVVCVAEEIKWRKYIFIRQFAHCHWCFKAKLLYYNSLQSSDLQEAHDRFKHFLGWLEAKALQRLYSDTTVITSSPAMLPT